jgi:Fe-S cluster assembly protein SufB
VPYIESKNASAVFEHEATTSKISDDQLFYCMQRGLDGGGGGGADRQRLRRDVLQQLPMEFAVEAQKLIAVSHRGAIRPILRGSSSWRYGPDGRYRAPRALGISAR